MAKTTKKRRRLPLLQRIASRAIAFYVWLAYRTGRWTVVRGDIPERLRNEGEPFICVGWHGRMMMMPYAWEGDRDKVLTLISSHADGRFVSSIIRHLGYETITGSTSIGGSKALRHIVKSLREGYAIAVTPDGPRGPRMRMSDGVLTAARLSGAAIVPAAYSAKRRHVFGTWDRFIAPYPFTRGVFVWGEPIWLDRDDPHPRAEREAVEQALLAVTNEADAMFGHEPIKPDDLPRKVFDALLRQHGGVGNPLQSREERETS